MMIEAAWWETLEDGRVQCRLCPIECRLEPGRDGPCHTRGNRGGRMTPLHYGEVAAAGLDPIEKKPLYHYLPGARILSVAAPGCNLHCRFCQNWELSQDQDRRDRYAGAPVSPDRLVEEALACGSGGIAYTYSEPLVWYEFVRDTARLARDAGLKNVVVTNGYLQPEPLAELLPLLDAANIDLKSMDDDFYRRICKASLDPVLSAIRDVHAAGVHLELTNLLIPGYNDADDQISMLVDFVAGLGRDIPLHFSAYHPAWDFDAPPTPVETLRRAAGLARRKLDHVYLGNVRTRDGSNTICPGRGATVIERGRAAPRIRLTAEAACPDCGTRLPVVME